MRSESVCFVCLFFLLDSIFSQTNTQTTLTVVENIPVGTNIGRVSCDGPAAQYVLDDQSFSITNDGTIQVASALDREAKSLYKFEVRVAHSAQLACRISVTVQVQDMNDNSPIFTSDYYHLELPHHVMAGTVIGSVQAMDFDLGLNGQVTYSLQPSSPAFSIDPATGEVSVKNPREVPSQAVQVVVLAADKGTPPLQSTSYIHIMPAGSHNRPMK